MARPYTPRGRAESKRGGPRSLSVRRGSREACMSTDSSNDALARARTLGEALSAATERLRAAGGSETPQLDAQVLMAHISGAGRATLLAYPERALPPEQAAAYAN